VGPDAGRGAVPTRIIDARGGMAIPGFVSAHYHSHDVLLRGSFEPLPLEGWYMVAVPPNYPKRTREEIKARAMLGALECLRGGITTIQDMATVYPFDEDHVTAMLEAYEEVGIRVVLALQVADVPGQKGVPFWEEVIPKELHASLTASVKPLGNASTIIELVRGQLARWRGKHERVTWGLGPATPENCSTDFLERIVELSVEADCRVFTHVYESKSMALNARRHYKQFDGSLIRYMESIGLLNNRLTMAHCVWLTQDEIERIAAAGTSISVNPVSNLKTKSGVAPIREMIEAGVRVALGTDNCSCSDAQNMFQSMKLFCLLTAASHGGEGRPAAADALRAATQGSATAVGLSGKVGKIAPGFKADFSILDPNDPALLPLNDPVRQIVYSESGRAVRHVIVHGEVVIRDGASTRIDEAAFAEEVERLMPALRTDLAAVINRNRAVAPYLRKAHELTLQEDIGLNRFIATPLG
jgi:guanine deaminase